MNSHALNVIEFPRTLALVSERATSPLGAERVRELRPVVDRVFPLSEARAAHEYLEAGEQFGQVVLSIP